MTEGDGLAAALEAWRRLLEHEPDQSGGSVVLIATGSDPPSLALLTTSSVHLPGGETVLVAVQSASSVARRPASSATLLSADGATARRLEVEIRERIEAGGHQVLVCRPIAARDMREAPWALQLRFAAGSGDATPLLQFWSRLRDWLRSGAQGDAPSPKT